MFWYLFVADYYIHGHPRLHRQVEARMQIALYLDYTVPNIVVLLFILAAKGAYDLSNAHPHEPHNPGYPYLHIRSKDFPWGPDGLFEKKHH